MGSGTLHFSGTAHTHRRGSWGPLCSWPGPWTLRTQGDHGPKVTAANPTLGTGEEHPADRAGEGRGPLWTKLSLGQAPALPPPLRGLFPHLYSGWCITLTLPVTHSPRPGGLPVNGQPWERALGLGSWVRAPRARAHHGGPLTARGKPHVLPRRPPQDELESVKCAVVGRKRESGPESRRGELGARAPHGRPPPPMHPLRRTASHAGGHGAHVTRTPLLGGRTEVRPARWLRGATTFGADDLPLLQVPMEGTRPRARGPQNRLATQHPPAGSPGTHLLR